MHRITSGLRIERSCVDDEDIARIMSMFRCDVGMGISHVPEIVMGMPFTGQMLSVSFRGTFGCKVFSMCVQKACCEQSRVGV